MKPTSLTAPEGFLSRSNRRAVRLVASARAEHRHAQAQACGKSRAQREARQEEVRLTRLARFA